MDGTPRWIGRIWEGSTRAEDSDAYLAYLGRTGFPGYREAPGNCGVLALRHRGPGETRFLLLTFWESEQAIRRFTGGDPSRARFYPEDERFLIDRGETVRHLELVHAEGLGAP